MHGSFKAWLTLFKENFEAKEREHDMNNPFVIAFCCKAGINRSIACARISEHVLSRSGYSVDVVWLSSGEIDNRGICTWCSDCNFGPGMTRKKAIALDNAFRRWIAT